VPRSDDEETTELELAFDDADFHGPGGGSNGSNGSGASGASGADGADGTDTSVTA
jgi:hypothetical protein